MTDPTKAERLAAAKADRARIEVDRARDEAHRVWVEADRKVHRIEDEP